MGNKDEKTFADLFSSSTTEKEATTQTFSDILNSSTETDEISSSPVTFDNIFDQIAVTEPKEDKKTTDSNLSEPTAQEITESKIEQQEDIITSKTSNDNLFFSNQATEPVNKIETVAKKDETKENDTPEQQESELSDFNPFFTPSPEEVNEKNNEIFSENTSTEKEVQQEILEETNPFFEITEPSKETIIKPKEENIEATPIATEVNTSAHEDEKKEEANLDTIIVENPFFGEETKVVEEKSTEPPKQATEENNIISKDDVAIFAENKNVQKQELQTKSTSPFFQEEKPTEENPFFQNQLNLIENQIPNAPSGNIDTTKSKHYNVKIVKKKEPLIKFVLGVLSYAIFIWLLLIGITLLIYVLDIKIRAAKGDYSSPTFNAYVVLTGSMLPEIQVNDVVITKKVDAEKLNEGDVITFASADSRFLGTIITHRIIKKNPKTGTEGYTFQTKGDNNNVADSALVPEKNIYGKVILKIPKLGYLQEFLASDGGWIIVILIPCLTVISYDIVKLAKGLKKKKYKNIKVQK